MRKILIILAAALLMAPAMAGTKVLRHPEGQITLLDQPCDQPSLMAEIRPEFHASMKVSTEYFRGINSRGCWLEYNGNILLTWTNGAKTAFQVGDFKDSPGI